MDPATEIVLERKPDDIGAGAEEPVAVDCDVSFIDIIASLVDSWKFKVDYSLYVLLAMSSKTAAKTLEKYFPYKLLNYTITPRIELILQEHEDIRVSKDLYEAIQLHGKRHVLTRTPFPHVAERFLQLYGFKVCKSFTPEALISPYSECEHFIHPFRIVLSIEDEALSEEEKFNKKQKLKRYRCTLDRMKTKGNSYLTSSPVLNALLTFTPDMFRRFIQITNCDVQFERNTLLKDAMNRRTMPFLEIISDFAHEKHPNRPSIGMTDIGSFIHSHVTDSFSDVDDADGMIKAIFHGAKPEHFKIPEYYSIVDLFCPCLRYSHLIIIMERGLDLSYLEDNAVFGERIGFMDEYLSAIDEFIGNENNTLDKDDLHNWKRIMLIIRRSFMAVPIKRVDNAEMVSSIDGVISEIDYYLDLPDDDVRFQNQEDDEDEDDDSDNSNSDSGDSGDSTEGDEGDVSYDLSSA